MAVDADPRGEGVPHWAEDDFRAYLRCGILAHGFARARCDECGTERLIAFSCKGRGVCPSFNTRRMVEVAAHLVVLDGLFSEDPDGSVQVHEASEPGTRDIQRLQQVVRRRVLRLFRRRELLDEPTALNMLTWQAAGGFSIDASVRISGGDRTGRSSRPSTSWPRWLA